MKFICLDSRSLGNGYILTNEREALVIEAGAPLKDVKKGLDFDISIINALIVSHSHGDHSKFMLSYLDAGIDTYALPETFLAYGADNHHRAKSVESERVYKVGNFRVMPFEVMHDVPAVGYLIDHPETGEILFVTDTFMLDYQFDNLSHILIEANYCDDILQANINSGRLKPIVRDRVFGSHIELQTCKNILMDSDLSEVQEIVLLHLSDGNSDAKKFIREISAETGKPVYVAEKGLELDFTKNKL